VRLTESYKDVIPQAILDRFEWAEVRNAAAVLKSTNPDEFQDLIEVLDAFQLEPLDILFPGGQKSRLAARVDLQFRQKGWREGQHDTTVVTVLRRMPWRAAGEKKPGVDTFTTENPGYKVDNVKGTVALDVEWNAKDGNLDRDVGQYRTLHDSAVIDVAVMITRDFDTIMGLATRLGRPDPFGGTTTTTLTKLSPRLGRGAAGGCPVLAIAITDRPYVGTPASEAEAKRIADEYEAERTKKKQKGIPAIEGDDEDEDVPEAPATD
jgi:restriction endonuclease BglII